MPDQPRSLTCCIFLTWAYFCWCQHFSKNQHFFLKNDENEKTVKFPSWIGKSSPIWSSFTILAYIIPLEYVLKAKKAIFKNFNFPILAIMTSEWRHTLVPWPPIKKDFALKCRRTIFRKSHWVLAHIIEYYERKFKEVNRGVFSTPPLPPSWVR